MFCWSSQLSPVAVHTVRTGTLLLVHLSIPAPLLLYLQMLFWVLAWSLAGAENTYTEIFKTLQHFGPRTIGRLSVVGSLFYWLEYQPVLAPFSTGPVHAPLNLHCLIMQTYWANSFHKIQTALLSMQIVAYATSYSTTIVPNMKCYIQSLPLSKQK